MGHQIQLINLFKYKKVAAILEILIKFNKRIH